MSKKRGKIVSLGFLIAKIINVVNLVKKTYQIKSFNTDRILLCKKNFNNDRSDSSSSDTSSDEYEQNKNMNKKVYVMFLHLHIPF